MRDNDKVNAALVDSLGSALRSGDHGLKTVPALLQRVLREDAWRSFTTQRGEHVAPASFEQFVVQTPLKGLGASMRLIEKIVDSIEDKAERRETQDLLDQARQRGPGRPETVNNIDGKQDVRPRGTSRAASLRRLRKDAPEMHAEVIAGRLSAHAAMVQAGFRKKTLSVPISDTVATARALRRNLDDAAIAELIDELSKP